MLRYQIEVFQKIDYSYQRLHFHRIKLLLIDKEYMNEISDQLNKSTMTIDVATTYGVEPDRWMTMDLYHLLINIDKY